MPGPPHNQHRSRTGISLFRQSSCLARFKKVKYLPCIFPWVHCAIGIKVSTPFFKEFSEFLLLLYFKSHSMDVYEDNLYEEIEDILNIPNGCAM